MKNNIIYELNLKEKKILENIILNNTNSNSNINQDLFAKEYYQIFLKYSKLEDIESLKRAIFIQWYSVVEPTNYSGIGELNQEIEKCNVNRLLELNSKSKLDLEFVLMLIHYFDIGDWYFDSISNGLRKIIENNHSLDISMIREFSFEERGQMGLYWESIISNI